MIKIAFVIDKIDSPTAGTEKQLLLLIEKLNKNKFKPYLCILSSTSYIEENFTNLDSYNVNFQSFVNIKSYVNLVKFIFWIKHNEIDIVQTYFKEGNFIGVFSAFIASVKIILSSRRNQGYWYNSKKLFLLKMFNKLVTRFVTNCESTKKFLSNVENIDPSKIDVVYNGVDVDLYDDFSGQDVKIFKQKYKISDGYSVVGIVANLRKVKLVDEFLNSAAIAYRENAKMHFVIIGDGPERRNLEKLAKKLGLEDVVHFLGKREDIPFLLSCMDICVLTSLSESLSNSLLEYLAAGKIIVCTDVGGAKEIVEDGVNGIVVEPKNQNAMAGAMLKALHFDRDKFSKLNKKKAHDKFSMEKMVITTEKLFLSQIDKFKRVG